MIKKLFYIFIVFVMLFSLGACKKNEQEVSKVVTNEDQVVNKEEKNINYPITITDDSGAEIVIESLPEKIASGAPSTTEIIYALGKQKSLVGVTSYCNYPSEVSEKEVTGDYNGPNIEKIIELGVELYITDWIDDSVRSQLKEAGVETVVIAPSTYEAIYDRIELLGKILDAGDESAKLVTRMKDKTEFILSRVKGLDSKRVFFENWHDPLGSVGPGSFIDEMITMSGGENIASDMQSSYGEFSQELVIERDPEVYLTVDDGFKTVEDLKARTGYNEMTAVKNERIFFLDPDITIRPGPRIVEALESIAAAIHPEEFECK